MIALVQLCSPFQVLKMYPLLIRVLIHHYRCFYPPLPMFSPLYSQQHYYSHHLLPSQFGQPSWLCGNYFDQSTFRSLFINNNYYQSPPQPPTCTASNSRSEQVYFVIKFLEGNRICSCYGCGNHIQKDTSTIPPPHDLVIGYKERRHCKDPHTHHMRLTSTEENTYYHLMLKCVCKSIQHFNATC